MERLNLKTTHNLIISYPRADVWQRAVAFIIDFIIIVFINSAFKTILPLELLNWIVLIFTFFFYHLTFEILFLGQSLGKKLVKIRVVALDGGTPTVQAYLIRWAFRIIDIALTLGSAAILSTLSSPYGQRLGDLLAGTTVVQTKIVANNILSGIDRLNTVNRTIQYPGVVRYNDEEMLLLKKLVQRFKLHPTEENENLIWSLVERISNDLGILKKNIKDPSFFLQQLLEDYIILTR